MPTNPTAVIHGNVREIMAPELTDAQVATNVFMCSSKVDPVLILNAHCSGDKEEQKNLAYLMAVPEIGRDRLLYLSQRLERAEAILQYIHFNSDIEHQTIAEFLEEPKTTPSIVVDLMKRP